MAEAELADRHIENGLQIEEGNELVAGPEVIALVHAVDVAKQVERLDDRQVPPELGPLPEDDADLARVGDALAPGHAPEDLTAGPIGTRIPARILTVVDLPAPLGPM